MIIAIKKIKEEKHFWSDTRRSPADPLPSETTITGENNLKKIILSIWNFFSKDTQQVEKYVGKHSNLRRLRVCHFSYTQLPFHPQLRVKEGLFWAWITKKMGAPSAPQLVVYDYFSSQWETGHKFFSSSPVQCCRNLVRQALKSETHSFHQIPNWWLPPSQFVHLAEIPHEERKAKTKRYHPHLVLSSQRRDIFGR